MSGVPEASPDDLRTLFDPRGIALVGASRRPGRLGHIAARNLFRSGYQGAIHLVNPQGGSLFGRPVTPSILDVPDPVDLAVLLVSADQVPGVLEACGIRRVPLAVIASGGFRETGPEGAALERTCMEIAHRYGIRLLGPNCVGILDTICPFDTTFFASEPPPTGSVALLSQSGAVCASLVDWASRHGLGLSRMVSLGNRADITETELLAFLADDPHTRVILLYLEDLRQGRRFVEAAREAGRKKPLLALKVGRSHEGRRAAASHTGALAGTEAGVQAAFRRARIIRANTTGALFEGARALSWCPRPAGRRVAVLTNAGGPAVAAVDALESSGLALAQPSSSTHDALERILPPAASLSNPVDMLASATPDQYASCLGLLLADAHVDAVLVVLPPPPTCSASDVVTGMIPIITAGGKPVVVVLLGGDLLSEAAALLRRARIPDFRFPEDAVAALVLLNDHRLGPETDGEAAHPFEPTAMVRRAGRSAWTRARLDTEVLEPEAAIALVATYGIPVAASRFVESESGAVAAATELGYPAVLKLASTSVSHKTDQGAVILDLRHADAVRKAARDLLTRFSSGADDGPCRLQVQAHAAEGIDVALGTVVDPLLGPVLMVGSGGVDVEWERDVAFVLAPASRAEVEQALAETRIGRQLLGTRGRAPGDREAVVEAAIRLSALAADFPEIGEIDVNPLRVFGVGKGAAALDVRIIRRHRETSPGDP